MQVAAPSPGRQVIAYGVFICVTYQRVVPANAGTHTARTLVSSPEQRPFLTFEARGDGSLRSQRRPAERSCEATAASTPGRSWSYAIARPQAGRGDPSTRADSTQSHPALEPRYYRVT